VSETDEVRIRPLGSGDSIEALTDLLHRAYAALAAMGFRYVATYQDAGITRARIAKGECHVALLGGSVVGTVLLIPPGGGSPKCAWYTRPDVAVVSQFAVEPSFQGQGIGRRLLDHAEARALALGAAHVALDTAEGARHLIELYLARGYRHVGTVQWDVTNYRSVVMSKSLGPGGEPGRA
jgi:GNAT superfamily N-acetyltransferase